MDVDKQYDNDPDCEVIEFRVRGFRIGVWTWVLLVIAPVSLVLCHFFSDFFGQYLAVIPKNLTGLIQVWRLVTASLICASLLMLVLTIFELIFIFRMLEERIGSHRVWKFFLISTIVGNLALWVIFPADVPTGFGMLMGFFTAVGGLWYTHRNEKLIFFLTPQYPVRARVLLGALLIFSCVNWVRCGLWLVIIFSLLLVCIGYWTIRLMDHMAGRQIRNRAAASGNRGKSSYIELE